MADFFGRRIPVRLVFGKVQTSSRSGLRHASFDAHAGTSNKTGPTCRSYGPSNATANPRAANETRRDASVLLPCSRSVSEVPFRKLPMPTRQKVQSRFRCNRRKLKPGIRLIRSSDVVHRNCSLPTFEERRRRCRPQSMRRMKEKIASLSPLLDEAAKNLKEGAERYFLDPIQKAVTTAGASVGISVAKVNAAMSAAAPVTHEVSLDHRVDDVVCVFGGRGDSGRDADGRCSGSGGNGSRNHGRGHFCGRCLGAARGCSAEIRRSAI